MPRGDKTGPNGDGPMTGRGLGYCNDSNTQNKFCQNGRANRCGGSYQRGFGRGSRNWSRNNNVVPAETENNSLKDEIKTIREQLSNLSDLVTKK